MKVYRYSFVCMNRTLSLEKYQIEAWGLWWIQWQEQKKEQMRKEAKERIRKQTLSPRAFVTEHLAEEPVSPDMKAGERKD